ncbi:MAG TPA: hypothetical protein ENL12_03410, partial [Dehalococcoidia bacterium]|nr:hypothetical protein [Dehalococcoidia bacterium]
MCLVQADGRIAVHTVDRLEEACHLDCILAIDQGTTGSRAVLYRIDGTVAGSAYREFSQYFPRPGWVEHDPMELWTNVVGCVRDVLGCTPGARVVCIGVTNQRETVVV